MKVKSKSDLFPELRFSEFSEEWEPKRLESFGRLIPGLTYAPSDISENGVLVLRSSNIQDEKITLDDTVFVNLDIPIDNLSQVGDILICVRNGSVRLIGKNARITEKLPKATHGAFMSSFRGERNDFVYWLMKTKRYSRQVYEDLGARINSINSNNLKRYKFNVPKCYEEQQKIADFLSEVDEKLRNIKRKRELMKSYKHGLMQQIFSQQIRFKKGDDTDFPDWERVKLSDLLFEHKIRNIDLKFGKEDVLSVSGEMGIVNQIKLLGRSYAGESVANYHVVNTGDVVYTKSPLKRNPYGIIKANLGPPGIVSTLYAVYRCKESAYPKYIDYYFSIDENVNRYLRPLVHKGAKNDMKINNQRVLIDKVEFPSIKEQQKIADFLQSIDHKIDAVTKQITQLDTFKKGLLQKLFV